MKNRSSHTFLPLWAYLLFLLLTLAGGSLFSQSCDDTYIDKLELAFTSPSGGTATHTVYFKGVSYDTENCTSTWTYCVENGGSPDISHYAIGGMGSFFDCLGAEDIVGTITSTGGCPGEALCDPMSNTGICGIKFDCAISECDCFSFTLSGIYEVGSVYFGIKAGTQSEVGMIAGPICETATLSCDDGDPCTIDDVLDEDCNCAGTYVDEDEDGVCAAEDCDDNNPLAASTDNDRDCDGVPTGLDCDDNDPSVTTTLPDCCPVDFAPDCDGDGIPDAEENDCDEDGTPDDCEEDRNGNGTPDDCEADCDGDGIPDSAEMDCDGNGIPNDCELNDCDEDGLPDECEPDCDGDGIPNDCEEDCDEDGLPDDCELDCDGNGIPDDCELLDCDGDGIPDAEETDEDGDGVPDDCDICPGFDDTADADGDGIPDGCDADCIIDCDDCKVESGFGTEVTISFCCLSITIDNWLAKDGEPGEYVGFEITSATVDGEPISLDDVRYIVKAGGECFEGSGAQWQNPNGTSGPEAKAISHINFCENTELCGVAPLDCSQACPGLTGGENQQLLDVAPNPARGQINARYRLYEEQNVTIEVVGTNGNMYSTQIEGGRTGSNTATVDIQSLPSGVYLLVVRTASGVRIERFIKAE